MFRTITRKGGEVCAMVGVRLQSSKPSSTNTVTWSTGEVKHPAPLDCPVGNKGEYPRKLPDGGVEYFGFTYYPRHEGEVDPPVEPTPLHLVTRVRSLQRKPWFDREIMEKIGLDDKRSKVSIVKNTPEMNAMLWKVKHLIKVTPIKVPANLPHDADPRHCFLKETGEFCYTPAVKVEEKQLEEDPHLAATRMTPKVIDANVRSNWDHPWQLKLC